MLQSDSTTFLRLHSPPNEKAVNFFFNPLLKTIKQTNEKGELYVLHFQSHEWTP